MVDYRDIDSGHSLEKELNGVHTRLQKRINLKSKAKIDKNRAQQMEEILNYLKSLSKGKVVDFDIHSSLGSGIRALLQEEGYKIIQSSLDMIQSTEGINLNSLFSTSSKNINYSGRNFDDIAEAELAAIISSFEFYSQNNNKENINLSLFSDKIIANQTGEIRLDKELDKSILDLMTFLNAKIDKETGEILSETPYTGPASSKSGKVDVTGINTTYTAYTRPEWDELIKLFTGVNFSVKNYKNMRLPELGHTDVFKAIYGPLTDLGYAERTAKHIFYHGYNTKSYPEAAALHFYHLRFYYELTGAGLFLDGQALDKVDFLVYNSSNSDYISIKSTAEILDAVLNSNDFHDGLYSKTISMVGGIL